MSGQDGDVPGGRVVGLLGTPFDDGVNPGVYTVGVGPVEWGYELGRVCLSPGGRGVRTGGLVVCGPGLVGDWWYACVRGDGVLCARSACSCAFSGLSLGPVSMFCRGYLLVPCGCCESSPHPGWVVSPYFMGLLVCSQEGTVLGYAPPLPCGVYLPWSLAVYLPYGPGVQYAVCGAWCVGDWGFLTGCSLCGVPLVGGTGVCWGCLILGGVQSGCGVGLSWAAWIGVGANDWNGGPGYRPGVGRYRSRHAWQRWDGVS